MQQPTHDDGAPDSDPGDSEHEPLLPPAPAPAPAPARLARRAKAALGACLAAASVAVGLYVVYILCHAPALLEALVGSEPELQAVTLIDVTDDAVLVAADIEFPRWGRRAATIPSVNATVYHGGDVVGWLHATNLRVTPAHRRLVLAEAFHVVSSDAMAR
ncbi:hypothetical protein IWQ56_006831, partial [Coemansia nantahalensis]